MYQQITLIGNLGGDPELRYTPGGVPVCSFSLAVNKSWTDDNGKHDKTTWFRVTAWRKSAEIAAQYLTKGKQVLIVGEMEDARAYTDKSGEVRASLEVTAQTIKFLGGAGAKDASGNGAASESHAPEATDIPF
jgi:single-strand DNA-binding protein